ncbi:MAG: basic amino acid ABC transporter substrate-binding protein [Eubacteriales bacterium]|nr:basic amino acid ABC transporter substrate-binding protein [Eubacteriales bacterium]
MKKLIALLAAMMLVLCATAAMAEGTIVMATNAEFPPFEYKDDANNVIGFDADIAAEIAKDLGKELKIEDMAFDSVVTSVMQGKADLGIAGMTITEERLANVDFSDPYFVATQACVVKAGGSVTDEASLNGKKIGVQNGTTGAEVAENYTDFSNVSFFAKAIDAMVELQSGRVDAVIIDLPVAVNMMNSLADDSLQMIDVAFDAENYGIAIAKNQPELLASINATLARLKEDGTIDALYAKYFSGDEAE